ncbi:hypothetical protein KAFR_0D01090 [Kazachstania africana CBS 2517]|uniref:WW domain-containing protein n=1 Tax=Kazachstania africana (strain ATCC 22294 / BCRC 22015 / CBS 2517 / CECT 1963 / NBRC 1671 / NRRL Y-8276) TaxID=1071382 RepID=H2ATQ5_KAZAF|nr:hypothetical protein KAFR_0D01090 [Kazachstania africana CBS 2517]CCF57755.1 hypothetical protein KAFR_0D01090 [Kazachstania africana CBS 2517]
MSYPQVPEGWRAAYDESYKRYIYTNVTTNQTQWEEPRGTIWVSNGYGPPPPLLRLMVPHLLYMLLLQYTLLHLRYMQLLLLHHHLVQEWAWALVRLWVQLPVS